MKKQDNKQDDFIFDNEEYDLRLKEKIRKMNRLHKDKKKKSNYKKKSVLNNKREYINKNLYDYEY